MILLSLFVAFLQIGAFSFGGGYAAMPFIQDQVIARHGWMTITTFSDLVALAEMTPGPIAVNAATFVGNQVAGIPGAIVATLGVILPSCLFVTGLAWIYKRYRNLRLMKGILPHLRAVIVAIILTAGLSILLPVISKAGMSSTGSSIRWDALLLFLAAFVLVRLKKGSPILIMLGCGMVELFYQYLMNL